MRSASTAGFRKRKTCPSSQTLLLYSEAALVLSRRHRIAAHLSACDFCGAEMQLLNRHSPGSTHVARSKTVPIPVALRRLAEDLMALPAGNPAIYAELNIERERLTLTDA